MDANWSFTGAYATNTAFAGRLFGGVISLPSPYAPGTTFSFLVRGWSSSIAGQDWATVQAFVQNFEINPNASGSLGQFFGTSSIATTEIGGGTLPTQAIFGTTPGITIPGFLLDQVPVPEPSPFSLLAMGILASAVRIVRSRKAGK
jgi:hypothetical protein